MFQQNFGECFQTFIAINIKIRKILDRIFLTIKQLI